MASLSEQDRNVRQAKQSCKDSCSANEHIERCIEEVRRGVLHLADGEVLGRVLAGLQA